VVALGRWLRVLVALWATFAAAGCAGVITTASGQRLAITSPEFRDYVEQVFRRQNQTVTDLAFALEDAPPGDSTSSVALASAESTLLDACAGLNQLATARRDQQRLGPRRQAEAARQAPRCEAATAKARVALDQAGQ
jgi:hypothetical protein